MRTISKAIIAVAITAALCLTPLFAAERSDAVIINEGDASLSFKVGSMSNSDLDRLMTSASKNSLALSTLHMALDPNVAFSTNAWTLTDVKITDIKDYKLAMGTKYTSNSMEQFQGASFECKISFTATVKDLYTATLFSNNDGNQQLYKFITTDTAESTSVIKVDGTLVVKTYMITHADYFKTKENKACIEKQTREGNSFVSFSGTLNCEISKSGNKMTRNYTVDTDAVEDYKRTISYDYGNVSKSDVKANTEVMENTVHDKDVDSNKFRYKTDDSKSGGYEFSVDRAHIDPPEDTFGVAEAEDYWIVEDQTLPEYHYYGDDQYCMFTNVADADLRDDSRMESFLKGMSGSTVSDNYSDSKSVAKSASTAAYGDNSFGKDNTIFFVIIGVLGVAVVILALIAFKKK